MRIELIRVGKQILRVGIRAGDKTRTPLLLFNGIGASIELIAPFLEQLEEPEAIGFDVPGAGVRRHRRRPTPVDLTRSGARMLY